MNQIMGGSYILSNKNFSDEWQQKVILFSRQDLLKYLQIKILLNPLFFEIINF